MSSGELDSVVMELNKTVKALVAELRLINEHLDRVYGEGEPDGTGEPDGVRR